MSTPQRTKRQNADHWEKLVQECLDGGYKKVDFCKERGLNYPAFISHCTRVRKKSNTDTPSGQLIAMRLVTGRDDTPSAMGNPVLCSLTLKNGTALHVHDRQLLADILCRLIPNAAVI